MITDEDAAYCAAAWASGETQKSLAQTLGCSHVSVCAAIGRFLDGYSGYIATRLPQGDDRKALVPDAVRWFVKFRRFDPRDRSRTADHPSANDRP